MPEGSAPKSHSRAEMAPSVVIAAHNEESVIGRCLDALLDQQASTPFQIVVSANGCTDRTAEVAASRGVSVVDRPEAGKPGALNAGDRLAGGFPRCYLDADIVVPTGGIAALAAALETSSELLAVVPRTALCTRVAPSHPDGKNVRDISKEKKCGALYGICSYWLANRKALTQPMPFFFRL